MLDVVLIGAGHNGLAAAAYLARAGLRVRVLERRPLVGGACVTEELWPGFRLSRAAYVAGLLRPSLVAELGLRAQGLRLLPRDPSSFTPLPDGRSLLLGSDTDANRREIAAFSPRDAERYPVYEDFLDAIARAMEPLLDEPPPDPTRPRWRDLRLGLGALARLRRLGRNLPAALSLLLGAARPVLESWFESEPLRGTLATDALIGAWASPSSPGTGYVLFHHVMGESEGRRGVWSYVEGGMGRLSEALRRAASEAGAEVSVDAPVASISLANGRARGVVLEDGSAIEARVVVSGADPRHTFLELMDPADLPDDFAAGIRALDFRSPSLKINVALEHLPAFPSRPGLPPQPAHRGTIHLGATDLDGLESSFQAAAAGRLPERPMVELTLPSALDSTLAPPGRHVASLFVQHVPYALAGTSWDAARDGFADRVFAHVDAVAPGFSSAVLEREVLAPPDLERIFGLAGGNLFHGAMTPDRLLFLRPLPGAGGYRTPIDGLYLCGAGTHPGGGVMGACGRNAAGVVLRDLGNVRR